MKDKRSIVSSKTRAVCKKNGIEIKQERHRATVTKKKYKMVYGNYDLLEYHGVVSAYIRRKYDLDQRTLDFLCFLYPKGVFTTRDYRKFALTGERSRIARTYRQGHLERMVDAGKNSVYCLTQKSKAAVEQYHKYLLDVSSMPKTVSERGDKGSAMRRILKKLQG